jgi:hypothetical protein
MRVGIKPTQPEAAKFKKQPEAAKFKKLPEAARIKLCRGFK